MLLAHDLLIIRIEAAPNQCAISSLVVEKALIPESCVILIWLIECIVVSALGALEYYLLLGFRLHFLSVERSR